MVCNLINSVVWLYFLCFDLVFTYLLVGVSPWLFLCVYCFPFWVVCCCYYVCWLLYLGDLVLFNSVVICFNVSKFPLRLLIWCICLYLFALWFGVGFCFIVAYICLLFVFVTWWFVCCLNALRWFALFVVLLFGRLLFVALRWWLCLIIVVL